MAAAVQKIADLAEKQTQKAAVVLITPDNSYVANGYAIAVAGYEKLKAVVGSFPGYTTWWDEPNQKLKIFRQKDPANAGGADIALPEVAAAVDLSALSGFFIVAGY